jgi:carbon storage regulator
MLVLSRKPGEKISVGSDVVITILSLSPTRAKIGVEAPDDVRVRRGELVERDQLVVADVGTGDATPSA